MIHCKPTTRTVVSTLESNFSDLMKDQLWQSIVREELECVLITFPYKRNEEGTPTWCDMNMEVFMNGAFKAKYKEVKKEE